MIKYYVFTLLLGFLSAVEIPIINASLKDVSSGFCETFSWFLPGFGPYSNSSWTALDCSKRCSNLPGCKYWNWRDGTGCFLKTDTNPSPTRGLEGRFVGGDKGCRPGDVKLGDKQDPTSGESCITFFWLLPGFAPLKNTSSTECSAACIHHPDCKYWNWRELEEQCFLKTGTNPNPTKLFEGPLFMGGEKNCSPLSETIATKGWGFGSLVQGVAQGFLQGVQQGVRPSTQRPTGCRSDYDCSQSTACSNRDCVDPCNCGINAQCYVTNHQPVCYCPKGLYGNPNIECRTVSSSGSSSSSIPSEPPFGQRCSGRNYGERRCCSPQNPCNEGEGDCDGPGDGGQHDGNTGCKGSLVCGSNNCKQFGTYFHEKDDCCQKPESAAIVEEISPEFSKIPDEPPFGQRCSGRNYGERRCCNPENPCNEGEGDCDGPDDGGQHDGHAGCKGNLVCGSNNCKQFGTYFHEKDDCCQKPSSSSSSSSSSSGSSIIPSEPPYGQRCSGRNYGERRCCSPENPCNEGEGDCDGPGDGGQHDGNTGCKGNLVCGTNNCKQFGTYFHEKDDCCQKPSSSSSISSSSSGGSVSFDGWSSWGPWNQCSRGCGGGKKSRHRTCSGPSCRHTNQTQERNCNTHQCFVKGPK